MSFLSKPEFKVGFLVVGMAALIAFMSVQVSDDPGLLGSSKKVWFFLPSAAGLIRGSAIKSAGIPVGVIKAITLKDGQARIDVTVSSDVPLTTSASVAVKSNGILGDKGVEIYPGNVGDPELENGAQIETVKSGGGLDDVMGQVTELAASLKDVAKNLKEATSGDGTDRHVLGRIVLNIEKVTHDLSQMTSENKDQISEIVTQVNDITATIDDLVNDESEQGFKKTWKKTMVRLDATMKNVEEITGKINRGEGTIGKLISDEKTSEDVSTAIEGISGLVDSANKVSTGIDFHGDYLGGKVGGTKTTIGITLQPGLDRYYYLGIVSDPAGVKSTEIHNDTVNGITTSSNQETIFKNKTKLTLLFAKNFYDITFRAGLMEDTGGIGVDYHFTDRFKFSFDAYDFQQAQLRAFFSYNVFYGFYLNAGYNDILNKRDSNTAYLGAGLFLTNDDLKLLLAKAPF